LAAANKRVGNILAKFDGDLFAEFNKSIANEPAELTLADAFMNIQKRIKPYTLDKDYQAVLTELSQIKQPIDDFFDSVMVMAEDEKIKINRLTLLNDIRNSFLVIADISLLQS